MRSLAVIGHLSRDVVAGAPPRIGGGPWHAGRALRLSDANALLVAKSGDADHERQLASLGSPVTFVPDVETTSFSFSYDERGVRTMRVDAIGTPWRVDELPDGLPGWVFVATLLRGDAGPDVLERLARTSNVLLDGQGLARARETGALVLDGDFDRRLLRHVRAVKLSEEEADAVGEIDVPELIVTHGLRGATVNGEFVPARAVATDPTGAGDAFAAGYVAARAQGEDPLPAARRATALVEALLSQ
ncbi:MAG TPA: PfkB family carbohydrate kinase [Gaiellaceae bacterium]|nr:PfkB family carbohydrate kinase [Gaiellaceae bacterium]